MASVLVIEDEIVLGRNICDSLELAGHSSMRATTAEEGLELSRSDPPDLVLVDYRLPGMDGLGFLEALRGSGQRVPAVMMTAHGDVSTAVSAMKTGAVDFLCKPVDLATLLAVVERTLRQQRLVDELAYFKDRERSTTVRHPIIGESEPMGRVREMLRRITSTPAMNAANPPSVLITGETGTGKGLVARTIHFNGPRHGGRFVHVNCAAIPDNLAESEFFGHVKGAFTDAKAHKRGLFEQAHNGTLFLDEIGHMPMQLQSKLLHVVEQRVVRPIGAVHEREVDVHLLAATNRDLEEAIATREFREDLFHRLRVMRVDIPPLRDRGDDVERLARHFLAETSSMYGLKVSAFSESAIRAIRAYNWPGNVRELRHAIESAALIANETVLTADQLAIQPSPRAGVLNMSLKQREETITVDFHNNPRTLQEIENDILLAALEHFDHNYSQAARVLGISRDAIRYRLEKFKRGQIGGAEQDNGSPEGSGI